jgi:hypothetical protein
LGFIVVSFAQLEQKAMLTLPKGNYNIQNLKSCLRFSHYNHIYYNNNKNCKCFCAIDECDNDSKKLMFLIKMDDYQKCVTQTRLWLKMDAIIKRV